MGSPYRFTVANAITALRDTIGDPSTGGAVRWSDAECCRYLNRAGFQLTLNIPDLLETAWTTPVVTGTRSYEMPNNFTEDHRVFFVNTTNTDQRRLEYLTWEEWTERGLERDISTPTGVPIFYTFWRKLGDDLTTEQPTSIYLHPIPGTAESGKILQVWGFKVPDTVVETDTTKVLETEAIYVEAQVMYAAHLMAMDDDDDGKSDRLLSRFDRIVERIHSAKAQRTRSERPMIHPRDSIFTTYRNRGPILPRYRNY